MNTAYDILASAKISHDYYTNKYFDAFDVKPDEQTTAIARQFGLLSIRKKDSWYLLYQTFGPRTVPFENFLGKELQFIMKITDPDFNNITSAKYIPAPSVETAVFTSALDQTSLPTMRRVEPKKFNYEFQHVTRPVHIKLQTINGTLILDRTVIESEVKNLDIDVSDKGESAYDLTEDTVPPSDVKIESLFVSDAFFSQPFYGVIYFKIIPQSDNSSNHYEIQFEKK